jgi:hypothetical protein
METTLTSAPAGCEKCNQFVDRQDVVHCVRTCKNCGRTMYVHEPGAHGLGMILREGDIVTIPAGYFKLAFNPLKTNVRFSKAGLQWLAELIFLEQLPDQSKRDTIEAEIARAEANCIEGLSQSALLGGLNPNIEADAEKIIHLLKDRKDTAEFWRLNELSFLGILRQALEQRMPDVVAWATACAERCRTMRIYKESLEEVVWMGNSASRLLTFLQLWNEHQTNDDEEFWQIKLTEHSYVLSQIVFCAGGPYS